MSRPALQNLWIIDGHNVIHHTAKLEQLQTSDRRREARDTLIEIARRLAMRRSLFVLICFDGIDLPGQPGSERSAHIEVAYSPAGIEADDIILHRAQVSREEGAKVTVVSDDGRMLRLLPKGVSKLPVAGFWKACAGGRRGGSRGSDPEGKPTGTDRDIWEAFLAAEPEVREMLAEAGPPKPGSPAEAPGMKHRRRAAVGDLDDPRSPLPTRSRKDAPATSGFTVADRMRESGLKPVDDRPQPEPVSPEEKLRLKKERGRRKQARRLAKQGRPGGGKKR